jgi:methanethiol S-methyltransferase
VVTFRIHFVRKVHTPHIRHPIYASYILAFMAALVALPTITMLLVFVFNAVLFTHAAYSDERSLTTSALGSEYASYKNRTGMLLPRFKRRASET